MLMTSPIRLLLVDDDDVDRAAVCRSLQKSGLTYELVEAHDFSSALDALTRNNFECVLLDFHLPGKNGMEVFHAIPSVQPEATPAVIFLTGEKIKSWRWKLWRPVPLII